MGKFKGIYRREKEDEDASREVPLQSTDRASAEAEATEGMHEDEKVVDVVEEDDGVFTTDHSRLDGSDRLG